MRIFTKKLEKDCWISSAGSRPEPGGTAAVDVYRPNDPNDFIK